jgi:ABC-type branched-subunit amino acid transport system permease subunit
LVILVRKGTTGRYLAALRGSELAAATIGINPVRAKLTVFALSAGVAGLGGGMLGSFYKHTSAFNFNFLFSLVFMVLVLTTGARTVEGAVNAGMAFALFPEILGHLETWLHVKNLQALEFALFGFGAVTYAKHPEGIVEKQKRASMESVMRRRARRSERREPPAPPGDGEEAAALVGAAESRSGR